MPFIALVLIALAPYAPKPVPVPRDRPYLDSTGAIRIVGYADVQPMFEALDRLFAAAHPGFKFVYVPRLTRKASAALADGSSALAPMGAEFETAELAYYRRQVGADPLPCGIAHDPPNAQAKSGPVGIFVNPGNPLAALTTGQVERIFARMPAGEQLTRWGQLGLSGAWKEAPIQPCGVPFGVGIAVFMQQKFGGRASSGNFLPIVQSEAILRYVAGHPHAIGFARMNLANDQVKLVGIDPGAGRGPSRATAEDVISGRYPYDRRLLLYLRPPLEPWVREYLHLVYSREGQAAIAASPPFYLPLTADQAAAELARLP